VYYVLYDGGSGAVSRECNLSSLGCNASQEGQVMDHHIQAAKASLDIFAGLVTVGAFFDFLPSISALFGVLWYGICIYDYFFPRKVDKD